MIIDFSQFSRMADAAVDTYLCDPCELHFEGTRTPFRSTLRTEEQIVRADGAEYVTERQVLSVTASTLPTGLKDNALVLREDPYTSERTPRWWFVIGTENYDEGRLKLIIRRATRHEIDSRAVA